MKNETLDFILKITLFIFGVKLLTKLFQGLQIFDTQKDRDEKEAFDEFLMGSNSPYFKLLFSPNVYWEKLNQDFPDRVDYIVNKFPNIQILKDKIYNAEGFWNDDENSVYAVFQSFSNFDELAWFCYYFQNNDVEDIEKTGVSVGQFLAEFFNESDYLPLYQILKGYQLGSFNTTTLQTIN